MRTLVVVALLQGAFHLLEFSPALAEYLFWLEQRMESGCVYKPTRTILENNHNVTVLAANTQYRRRSSH